MLKFLGKLLTLILAILFGFWLAITGLLDNTPVGDVVYTIMDYLPISSDGADHWAHFDRFAQIDIELPEHFSGNSDADTESVEEGQPVEEAESSTSIQTSDEVNFDIVEDEIIRRLNDLRREQGLTTLSENQALREGGYVRAQELEESFSHTRPNGQDPFTVFDEGIEYNYEMIGENLGMATYYMNEEDMSELIFEGWVESEGHYENMIRPEYQEIGIGVHYDGEYLYAVQMFGTPR